MDDELRWRAEGKVDRLFNDLKTRLLSGRPGPPQQSLPGLYASAAGLPSVLIGRTLRPYLDSLSHHLDARCSAAKADVLRALADADSKAALKAAQQRIQDSVRKVLETESTAVRNVASLAVVERRANALGVEDPQVYFVTSPDCCAECRRMFWLGERPKVWLASELGSAYHKRGDEFPKVGGCHPNCKCLSVFLPPGYGFLGGKIKRIGSSYDELVAQRAT